MAVSRQVTVTGAAGGTPLAGSTLGGGPRVRIRNAHATTSCYVGGNETVVTAANGYTLGPQQTVELLIGGNDSITGLSAISTLSVTVEVISTTGPVTG